MNAIKFHSDFGETRKMLILTKVLDSLWGDQKTSKNQKRNYLLECRPLVVQASPIGKCSRNPSVSVYQLALL